MFILLLGLALLLWTGLLLTPWRAWRMGEALEPAPAGRAPPDLSALTVLVPARDEAGVLGRTLPALVAQGRGLQVILIDDQSTDGTPERVRALNLPGVKLVDGVPLPPGWSGKLWALEQGLAHVQSEWVLLLDADIELRPGLVEALRAKQAAQSLDFVSLMAHLRMEAFWERLLLPAFIYFFKLIYPFALSNRPGSRVAAAAGGCILVRRRTLEDIGGFAALRGALIDDCTLARLVKARGGRLWTGVTRGALSLRAYPRLQQTWDMVARTAYTQLHYSVSLLLLCTAMMGLMFLLPPAALAAGGAAARVLGGAALLAMWLSYAPTLRYYGLSAPWGLALPLVALLYLAMTWSSAWRYWRGERSRWKGRQYAAH